MAGVLASDRGDRTGADPIPTGRTVMLGACQGQETERMYERDRVEAQVLSEAKRDSERLSLLRPASGEASKR